jgi:tetratricopeptide (TPR) repeat protein
VPNSARTKTILAYSLIGVALAGFAFERACGPWPRNYRDAIAAGRDELRKGNDRRAERAYVRAFRFADAVGNPSQAVWAAQAAADLAGERGDFAAVERTYDQLSAAYGGEADYRGAHPYFRIGNNLAVAKFKLGKLAEARALFEKGLEIWETMPHSPAYPLGVHMLLLRNIARIEAEGWGPSGDRHYQELLEIADRGRGRLEASVLETLRRYAECLKMVGRSEEVAAIHARVTAGRLGDTVDFFEKCRPLGLTSDAGPRACYLEIE